MLEARRVRVLVQWLTATVECFGRWPSIIGGTRTVAVILIAICATRSVAEEIVPPPQYVTSPPSATMISEALKSLDQIVLEGMKQAGIPGVAVGVVHAGKIAYAKGFGVRSVETEAPVDTDTVFLLASLSKPLGATVVAHQVSKGIVTWNTPMAEIMPEFTLGDQWVDTHVTIGDLYAHRSGLPDHAGDDLEDLGFDQATVINQLHLLPMGRFRVDYAYTNFGLTAAAEAVARASGTDWATLSETAIYNPLGMMNTSSRYADYLSRHNRAASHIPSEDGFVVADLRQPDAQSPAGGASASISDMTRWMIMVLGEGRYEDRQLIARDALLPAVTPQITANRASALRARSDAYGYGFNVGIRPTGRVMLSHSGAFALGAATSFMMIPDLEVGIVVLTNAPPSGVPEAIAATFADLAESGESSRDWFTAYGALMASLMEPVGSASEDGSSTSVADPRSLSTYSGTFENAYFGQLEIEARSDGLWLVLGPNATEYRMTYRSGDTFTISPFTENQSRGSTSKVTITRDGDVPLSVHVEHLDEYNWGTFRSGR